MKILLQLRKAELDTWVAEKVVNYWGKLSDVRPAIAASSVYVLPSYREGTPRTVLRRWRWGVPLSPPMLRVAEKQ